MLNMLNKLKFQEEKGVVNDLLGLGNEKAHLGYSRLDFMGLLSYDLVRFS